MVRIITDSAADFEPAELAKRNIACIPLKVLFGAEEYEENINLSKFFGYKLTRADKSCLVKTVAGYRKSGVAYLCRNSGNSLCQSPIMLATRCVKMASSTEIL